MDNKYDSFDKAGRIRKRAEEIVNAKDMYPHKSLNEIQKMLYELQVHQIELEMQNEELRNTQIELENSRSQYFDLYDMAPVGYCTLSDKGLILTANLTVATLIGISRNTMVNRPFSKYILREDQDTYYFHLKNLFETGMRQVCELHMIMIDDNVPFWARLESIVVKNNDGHNICLIAISDISRQKEAEEKIKESEQQYKYLYEFAGVGISYYKPDGTVISYNKKAAEIMGGSTDDFAGKSVCEIFPKAFADLYLNRIRKSISCDNRQEYEDYIPINCGVKWLYSTFNRIMDSYGNINGIQIITQDITEQKLITENLKISEEKYRLITENASDVIWVYNTTKKKFVYISPSMFSLLGLTPEEAINDNFEKAMIHELERHIDIILKNMIVFLESPQSFNNFTYEIQQTFKNGDIIWVEVSSKYRMNSDGDIEVIGVSRNVDDRKKIAKELFYAKEIAEKNSLNKVEYIANMSHELRTPLTIMLGAIQLFELYFKGDINTEKIKITNYMKSMKQNCLRMVRLVNNLIDSTKIDSGHYELNLLNYDILKIIQNITTSVSEYVKQKNIEIVLESNATEIIIACDADVIERIMLNLISNAIKFTNLNGLIRIRINKMKDNVFISVIDNGIGIEEDKQEIIFERYRQGEKLFSREHEGSGIGLSLIKSLIEIHGGKISLKSKINVGSEFIVELPMRVLSVNNHERINENHEHDVIKIVEKMNVEFSDIYR